LKFSNQNLLYISYFHGVCNMVYAFNCPNNIKWRYKGTNYEALHYVIFSSSLSFLHPKVLRTCSTTPCIKPNLTITWINS
jgi:hypothetical protein